MINGGGSRSVPNQKNAGAVVTGPHWGKRKLKRDE
jgi:hypothetical protein